MTFEKTNWIAFGTIVVLSGIVLVNFRLTNSVYLDVDLGWEDYSSLLTNLAFIAIVLERFIEVFLGTVRTSAKRDIQEKIRLATDVSEKVQAETELERYRAQTATHAMRLAFVLGLIASLAGIRTLALLFDAVELVGFQAFLFHLMDILLTAGLVAGGSKAINQVTDLFGSHIGRSANLAKKISDSS